MTTTAPAVSLPTARTLIDTGACSGLCLTATSAPRACRCVCAGRWHGALLDAPVVDAVEAGQAA